MEDPKQQQEKKQRHSNQERRIMGYMNKPFSFENDNFDPQLQEKINEKNSFRHKIKYYTTIYHAFKQSGYVRQKRDIWRRFSRESLPMLLFVTFSTYIIWKMESQYDFMRQRIQNVKSYHQIDMEQENESIKQTLMSSKKDFSVPIQEQVKKQQKYKFEDEDEDNLDDTSVTFDTKQDFYDSLQKDLDRGIVLEDEYSKDLQRHNQRQKSKESN